MGGTKTCAVGGHSACAMVRVLWCWAMVCAMLEGFLPQQSTDTEVYFGSTFFFFLRGSEIKFLYNFFGSLSF